MAIRERNVTRESNPYYEFSEPEVIKYRPEVGSRKTLEFIKSAVFIRSGSTCSFILILIK